MAQYEIHIHYKDEKSVNLILSEQEIEKFFDSLSSSQVYKHPESKSGFWTNLEDIRYITLGIKEEQNVPDQPTIKPGTEVLQERNENSEG